MKNEHSRKDPSARLTQEQVLDALPGYVLGALEPDEMLAVDAYLEQHPELQERVDDLDEIVMDLALTVPPVAAPHELKTQVMARARTDMATRSVEQPDTPQAPDASAGATKTDMPSRRVRPPRPLHPLTMSTATQRPAALTIEEPQPPWWAWLNRPFTWQLATVAATIALVAVTVTALRYQNSLLDLETQLAATAERVTTLERENETLQQDNVALRQELMTQEMQVAALHNSLSMLSEPERVVTLDATEETENANLSGSLYISQNNGLLLLRGLPPLPESEIYQLWLIPAEGDPVSAGLIAAVDDEPPGSDVTVWADTVPLRADQFAAVGVSIEPAGGSPAPTGPIILLGSQA